MSLVNDIHLWTAACAYDRLVPCRGVGVLLPDSAQAASALLEARGIHTWVMGEVHAVEDAPVEAGVEVLRGAKGVEGGTVQVVGEHPGA